MRLIALDTETELIARGRQVPPLVCLSWAELRLEGPQAGTVLDKGLLHHGEAIPWLLGQLADDEVTLVGASVAYDALVTSAIQPYPTPEGPSYRPEVLGPWVRAYRDGRVHDVLVRQKLLDLAAGCYRRQQVADGRWVHHRYNLAAVAQRMCGLKLDKGDPGKAKRLGSGLTQEEHAAALAATAAQGADEPEDEGEEAENHWRLRYAELRDVPLSRWPQSAIDYALDDAEAPVLVWWAQQDPGWRAMQVRRAAVMVGHVMAAPPVQAKPPENPALARLRAAGAPVLGVRSGSHGEGWNIWSGSREGDGLAAALTNPTELSRQKGNVTKSYPVEFAGKTWPDVETAWFALSKLPSEAERDSLMVDLICAKLKQHPELVEGVRKGGSPWLRKCRHRTNARTAHMQAWEGEGTGSRFIRNLVAAYDAVTGLNPPTHGPPLTRLIGLQPPTQQATAASDQLWRRVREQFGPEANPYADQARQCRGALWLRAMSSHGMVTDPEAVERFAQRTEDKHREVTGRLVEEGLVRVEWHLHKDKLTAWLAERGCPSARKADVLSAAQRMSAADRELALDAAAWLQVVRALRQGNPHEQGTLEWYEADEALALARERFERLEAAGLVSRTFHRDTKAAARHMVAVCEAEGAPIPRTATYDPSRHGVDECVALDKDACNSVDDHVLSDYSELSHLAKMLSADVPVLRSGAVAPIHTHFEELLETGRTGSSKPNVQNRARGEKCRICRGTKSQVVCLACMGTGAELGDRECFVPRQGWVMVDSDYSLGELHTLAQACLWLLGDSELAKVLRQGLDPHTAMACEILGIPYEEGVRRKKAKDPEFDNARNSAKAVNFGKPGGLSAKTMRAYAVRSYGVDKPLEEWERILKIWERLWTEMPAYFRYIDRLPKRRGQATVDRAKHGGKVQQLYSLVQPYSGRLRAGATYCSACNSVYQGLLSDVLKLAGWYLFCCCYLPPEVAAELLGPEVGAEGADLYGCRPCNEIHDQFLVEAPEERGNSAAASVGTLMNRAGREVLPDVPVRCEPILARRWSKRADLVKVDGRLVAWEDPRLVRPVLPS